MEDTPCPVNPNQPFFNTHLITATIPLHRLALSTTANLERRLNFLPCICRPMDLVFRCLVALTDCPTSPTHRTTPDGHRRLPIARTQRLPTTPAPVRSGRRQGPIPSGQATFCHLTGMPASTLRIPCSTSSRLRPISARLKSTLRSTSRFLDTLTSRRSSILTNNPGLPILFVARPRR